MSRHDIELAQRLLAGDETALAEIAADLCPQVSKWLEYAFHGRLLDGEFEDVLQEALLTLWLRHGKINPALDSLCAWLGGIAKNSARKRAAHNASERRARMELPGSDDLDILAYDRREIERPAQLDADDVTQDTSSPRESFRREHLPVMRELLATLSKKEREALLVADVDGCPISHAQAAEQLDMNANTFRSRLLRARAKIERECERRGLPKPTWRDWDRDGK